MLGNQARRQAGNILTSADPATSPKPSLEPIPMRMAQTISLCLPLADSRCNRCKPPPLATIGPLCAACYHAALGVSPVSDSAGASRLGAPSFLKERVGDSQRMGHQACTEGEPCVELLPLSS